MGNLKLYVGFCYGASLQMFVVYASKFLQGCPQSGQSGAMLS